MEEKKQPINLGQCGSDKPIIWLSNKTLVQKPKVMPPKGGSGTAQSKPKK